ncbi:hypothetical protein LDENG_00050170 [Lucifuga dentata]|nr:hypothetical protein LDENG_00050170 [Lucifuga dentata]
MDPSKPSLFSKTPNVKSGVGQESPLDEAALQWRDGAEGERQRDTETKEPEVVDGTIRAADSLLHHRGSADKHKFNTMGYQRRTRQKVVTDFTTMNKAASTGAKPRAALRQVFSQSLSDKNSVSEEQLDALKQALETYAVPVSLKWRWNEESQGTTLEENWTVIVHSHSTMSKIQRHQQAALWEFVDTELTYINKLMVIKDLVIAALINLHQQGFLLEISPQLLFSNLTSILTAHQQFWQDVIYPMVQEVRRTGKPFDPLRLEAGCLQVHERFSCYMTYCWEGENMLEFTRREMDSNPYFRTYVQWVETHPLCERMRLGDMQAKPHQRITKYPLLLRAMLKSTQDPHVQQKLKGMLSSVNGFLEHINNYLRLKDEELALFISAQRVEGYEVEGINEEIDKYVREICQFDLTCPIRGVGPGILRKLLLEENIKIRGRKDSKLEVVALLFSDVLLMTKVQKKGERLKVVRPPLALDRTFCVPLKDGSSFVLIEAGELWCAMNVYIFTTSTPESCSKWISTILNAKKTLRDLRAMEKMQLQNLKIQQLEAKPDLEAKTANVETKQQPLKQSREKTFVDELIEEPINSQSINGMLMSTAPAQNEPSDNSSGLPAWQCRSAGNHRKLVLKGFSGQPQAVHSCESIEMRVIGEQRVNHWEGEEVVSDVTGTKAQRMTWNHKEQSQSAPNLYDNFTSGVAVNPLRRKGTGPHSHLLGGYPDVDYPIPQSNAFFRPNGEYQPTFSRERSEFQREAGRPTRRDSDSQSGNQDSRRNSYHGQSGEQETLPEAWGFSRNLKSPVLRRRRPISSHQGSSSQIFRQGIRGSGHAWFASYNSSSSSDSDSSQFIKRNPTFSGQSLDSHRVLKLGSLKSNHGVFWSMPDDRASPDSPTLSEPELHGYNNRSSSKTQSSASTPEVIIHRGHKLKPSPLEGFLERAKDRVTDREGAKRDRNVKMASAQSRNWQPSPSFPTTPLLSDADGMVGNEGAELETEWEREVELLRHRALTVSKGWKEQLVDGDEDEKKSSLIFTDGVNVDWPGWCFDDDEVIDRLTPVDYNCGDEGLLEDISRTLPFWDLHRYAEQEDEEYSQV